MHHLLRNFYHEAHNAVFATNHSIKIAPVNAPLPTLSQLAGNISPYPRHAASISIDMKLSQSQ